MGSAAEDHTRGYNLNCITDVTECSGLSQHQNWTRVLFSDELTLVILTVELDLTVVTMLSLSIIDLVEVASITINTNFCSLLVILIKT